MDEQIKIKTKDLINIGAFTTLYVAVVFIVMLCLTMTPVTTLLVPLIAPIFGAPIFYLLLSKSPKFGVITIMGMVVAIVWLISGHPGSWLIIPFVILSEIIAYTKRYKGKKTNIAAYAAFALTSLGGFFMIFLYRADFIAQTTQQMGAAHADKLAELTPPWMLLVLFALAIIGSLIGSALSSRMLKKHFDD